MSMDLSKLTPAPWHCIEERDFVCAGGVWGAGNLAEHWENDAADRDSWEGIKADCEFIALARNAFDVMMRRGWFAFLATDTKWAVDDTHEDRRFAAWNNDKLWPDPFTALVEADKWYRENVEQA